MITHLGVSDDGIVSEPLARRALKHRRDTYRLRHRHVALTVADLPRGGSEIRERRDTYRLSHRHVALDYRVITM